MEFRLGDKNRLALAVQLKPAFGIAAHGVGANIDYLLALTKPEKVE